MLDTEYYLSEKDYTESETVVIDAPTICMRGSRVLFRFVHFLNPYCMKFRFFCLLIRYYSVTIFLDGKKKMKDEE